MSRLSLMKPATKSFQILFVTLLTLSTRAQTTVTSYSFDSSDEGWTVTTNAVGNWQRGVDIFSAGSRDSYWYTSPSDYSDNEELVIESPTINLTGEVDLLFSIDIRYNTEAAYDGFQVEYSSNGGGAWTDLGAVGDGSNWYNDTDVNGIAGGADGWTGDNAGWQTASVALPGVLENNATVKFRIRFQTDGSVVDEGVAFDNVTVLAGSEIQIEGNGIEIANGDSSPSLGDNTNFASADITSGLRSKTFTISNIGGGSIGLTGGTPVTISGTHASDFTVTSQPASSSLAGFESTTFTIEFNPSVSDTRTAIISVANDDADESPYTFDIKGAGVSAAVVHDFNSSNNGWTVTSNTNGDWVRGTAILNTGADGSYWHTSPTVNYSDDAVLTVQSPVLDLTGESDLSFYMEIRYNSEVDWDGFKVEYSSNGGTNWNDLGAVGDGSNWYNDSDINAFAADEDGWSGDNNEWMEAQIALPSVLDNNANARVRVLFESDGSVTDVGVAFDNVMIFTGIPELSVVGNSLEIVDGDTSPSNIDDTDFRHVDLTQGLKSKTYTVTNIGGGTVNFTGGTPVTITGTHSGDYTVTSQPVASLLGFQSTTFTVQFDPSAVGNRTASVSIASDLGTFTYSIEGTGDNAIIFQDFDASDESWTITSNTNGNWARGTGTLSSGADGNYWHSTPNGAYNSNAALTIQSGILDLTGQTGLTLYMDVRYDTEAEWDGYQVEYSSDGGTNWSDLGVVGDGINWYNDSDVDGIANNANGWSGDNSSWQTSEIDLPAALEGNSNVRIRVTFESDNNTEAAGVAFDNVIIYGGVSPLPVELVSFAGSAENNEITLDWITATELNNDYFEIQRSLNGVVFETIGKVAGNGTTSVVSSYDFVDSSPAYGVNYYRLRQVDYDGAQEFHQIIRVDNDFIKSGIEAAVYPNPSYVDNLNLKISSGDDHTEIGVVLYDTQGRLKYQKTFSPSLNLSEKIMLDQEVISGIYFLKVKQGASEITQKLIIN
ncbi:MAG: choice-of-anchor D domain-containing protein [Cyclobacteriaceae bacterium]